MALTESPPLSLKGDDSGIGLTAKDRQQGKTAIFPNTGEKSKIQSN
jgi:hypothetical protein